MRLLRLAQRSPSWCNTQPWEVVVTSGPATDRFREAIRAQASTGSGQAPDFPWPERYDGVYQERRRESGWQLYEAVGVRRGDRAASAAQAARNFELFGAPHVAIVTTDAVQGVYGAVDSGIYVGAFLLAAESMGIGAIAQAALAGYGPLIREHLGIPDDRKVLLGISFGFPDRDHPANSYRTTRADLGEVVRWVE
ncbi:nitroreductase [Pseudonocardia xishanensis]